MLILVVTISVLTLIGHFLFKDIHKANPFYWYLWFHFVSAIGTFILLDYTSDIDYYYGILYVISISLFIAGGLIAKSMFNIKSFYNHFELQKVIPDKGFVNARMNLLLILSILIVVYYYSIVGYNLFIDSIIGIRHEDFSTMRLAAYSGDEYFAPGYVNQFKNTLLPVISLFSYYRILRFKSFLKYVVIGVIIFFNMYALMGTGQRGFLIYTTIALLFGMIWVKKIKPKFLVYTFSILLGLFIFYSVLNERAGDNSYLSIFVEVYSRFFVANQISGLVAFRYIYSLDTVWFSEWLTGLAGILPGHQGSRLAHDVFEIIYGTDRGTAPPTFLGSLYYNGGLLGVLIGYFIKGFSYITIYMRFLLGRKSMMRVFAYGFLFLYLAMFVNGSPASLINNGMVTTVLLLFILKLRLYNVRNSV